MKKQYALIGLLTIVLGSTINVSAAQTTTNFSNNKNKEQISINLSSEEQKLITQEQKSVVNEIKKLDVDDEKFSEQLNKTINENSKESSSRVNYLWLDWNHRLHCGRFIFRAKADYSE